MRTPKPSNIHISFALSLSRQISARSVRLDWDKEYESLSLEENDREQDGKFMLFLLRFQGSQHHVAY